MQSSRFWIAAAWLLMSSSLWAQSFGRVVALGGHATDLALDEGRQVVYVANFTANRVDVVSLPEGSLDRSINVASQPSSLALSPDGRYLVVGHYGNFVAPNAPRNAVTVIDLDSSTRRTFNLADPPFGVAFGNDGRALVVTAKQFLLFDPVLGTMEALDTIAGVAAKTLPQPPATLPIEIIGASVAASQDGSMIYGVTDSILFAYDVARRYVSSAGYQADPPLGPRAVSVAADGGYYLAGWALFDRRGMLSQFPDPLGRLDLGGHAIDSSRGLVYAEVPSRTASGSSRASAPVLMVARADNLAVLERLKLPEHLTGKAVLSADGSAMYALSESGLLILPVGSLDRSPRVRAEDKDLLFRSVFCNPGVVTRELTIVDPGGLATDFSLSTSTPGVRITPTRGTTPMKVQVSIDPSSFANQQGITVAQIEIRSTTAVNLPDPVRLLINVQEPDQRGAVVNIPGKLVDILADPFRNRFFVLRQSTNEVLVYDSETYKQTAALRTGNTPTSMALTFDRRYLLVGNDNSQYANVYDLETLEELTPIRFPAGHYPRSIAASARAILAACRVAGPKNTIDRIDFLTRTATELPTLGVFENSIDAKTVLIASGNGSTILIAQADGNAMLYNANSDTFTISRKFEDGLSGAYAASNFDQFVIGNTLYNASLVPVQQFDASTGISSGFAFLDDGGFRSGAITANGPGAIQRVMLNGEPSVAPTRIAESPVLGDEFWPFTRTIALLADRSRIVNLTTSGFTVISWRYDAETAIPRITRVVNAADRTKGVAPGGLVIVEGVNLSPLNIATQEYPLPVALGESCLTVNGIPVPMLMVSPTRINAQLPFQAEGNVTMVLRTPGGVSDNYNLTILPAAPAVFRTTVGEDYEAPTVVRLANGEVVTPANPIRSGDELVIYLTGMGKTSPEIPAGVPTPPEAPTVLIDPSVDINGFRLPVHQASLVPGQIGVYQIRVSVPWTVPKGMFQNLRVRQGSYSSSVTVRVID